MNAVFQAAGELQAYCEQQKWQFCIIGGIALQHWGEPRVTRDVDLTLLTGFGSEEKFIADLLKRFPARMAGAESFALQHRVLLLQSGTVGMDIALAGFPFEEAAVQRSVVASFLDGLNLRICCAEDLITMKAFAGRPRDWLDLETIIIRQQRKLNWQMIRQNVAELCELKGTPETVTQLENLRTQLETT